MSETLPEGTLVTVFLHGMIVRPPPDIDRMDPDELRRYCRDLLKRNETLQEYLEGALEALDTMAARVKELEAKIGQVSK